MNKESGGVPDATKLSEAMLGRDARGTAREIDAIHVGHDCE